MLASKEAKEGVEIWEIKSRYSRELFGEEEEEDAGLSVDSGQKGTKKVKKKVIWISI